MWIFFAFLSALGASGRNVLSKFNVDNSNEYMAMWSTTVFAFIFGIPFVIYNGFEISSSTFWGFLIIRVILDSIAFWTYMRALKLKGVSYVIPLFALTPALTTVTSYFINGQTTSYLGFLGVIVICISSLGLFLIELDFKNFNKNKSLFTATALVASTVILWSILDSLHAEGIDRSNPYTYFFLGNLFFTIIFTIVLFITKTKFTLFESKKSFWTNSFLGIFLGVEFLSQLVALSSGLTAYVSAIKSLNITMSPILSWIFLKEVSSLRKTIIKSIPILGALGGVLLIVLG